MRPDWKRARRRIVAAFAVGSLMVPTALGFGAVDTRTADHYPSNDSAVEACGFWCAVAAGLTAGAIYDYLTSIDWSSDDYSYDATDYPGALGGGGGGGW